MEDLTQPSGGNDRLAREIAAFAEHESHPEPGVLAAYQARRLPADQADAVEEHLAQCRHCAELVLDLQEILGGVSAVVEPEREGEVVAFPAPAATGEPSPVRGSAMGAPGARPRGVFRSDVSRWLGLAALLVVSIGAYQIGRRQALGPFGRETRPPEVVSQSVTLAPQEPTRGLRGPSLLSTPSTRLPSYLRIRLPASAIGSRVYLEAEDAQGRQVWRIPAGVVPESGEVALYLHEDSLLPGEYRLRAAVEPSAGDLPLALYELRVLPPE